MIKTSISNEYNEAAELLNYFGIDAAPQNAPEEQSEQEIHIENIQLPVRVGKAGLTFDEGDNPWVVSRFTPGKENATPTHPEGHNGIDLKAPKGTPVYPIASGVVVKTGTDPKGGNVVFTAHAQGQIRVYYAHLDSILVRAGQYITQETPIGTVGDSGNAKGRGAHLHYEVRLNGQLTDPLTLTGRSLEVMANASHSIYRKSALFNICSNI